MKGVQCYELFGGIALKNHAFSLSGDLTNEIQRHISVASSAFGRLTERVFANRYLTIHTKIAVYNAVATSTILYGAYW